MSRLYSIPCPSIYDVSARLSHIITWPDYHYDISVHVRGWSRQGRIRTLGGLVEREVRV
jgi:hypothetical protein